MVCSALQSSQALEMQMVQGRVAEKQVDADCSLEREHPSITPPYIQRDAGEGCRVSWAGVCIMEAVEKRTCIPWRLCSLSAPRGGCSHEAGELRK